MRALALVVLVGSAAACGGAATPPARPPAAAPVTIAPPLPPPPALDPGVRGAPYLAAVAGELQPRWATFLEDCRLRLPAAHALNTPGLVVTAALDIERTGRVAGIALTGSGEAEFDRAVRDVLAEVPALPPPPIELVSDDDHVHLVWQFARDARQAGPATARLEHRALPLPEVIARLLDAEALPRAARRVLATSQLEPTRLEAAELVMAGALREALAADRVTQQAALAAIARARVSALAPAVRALIAPTIEAEVLVAAIAAAAALGDAAAADRLEVVLRGALASEPGIAVAAARALAAIGAAPRAQAAVREALEGPAPTVAALHAHAVAPTPAFARRLDAIAARGDATLRAAACAAVPPRAATGVIAAGLRDKDATVRAACLDAAGRLGRAGASDVVIDRVEMRMGDRDQRVRARAVAALVSLKPASARWALRDDHPEVRAAAAAAAGEPALRRMLDDPDAEVRAAAATALAGLVARGAELPPGVVRDPATRVRVAAARMLADEAALTTLARDPSPAVAAEATIGLAALRGREASLAPLLARLAAAPARSPERVHLALAWLLAPVEPAPR